MQSIDSFVCESEYGKLIQKIEFYDPPLCYRALTSSGVIDWFIWSFNLWSQQSVLVLDASWDIFAKTRFKNWQVSSGK